jgi:hypothetical protein
MCTGFEILPTIFGAGAGSAAAGAGLGLFGEAAGASLLGGAGSAAAGAAALGGAAELGLFGEAAASSLIPSGVGAAAGAAGAAGELGMFGEASGSSLFGAGAPAELGLFGEGIGQSLIPSAGAFASPLAALQGFAKTAQPYMSAASGVKGLMDAEAMKRASRRAMMMADPWGNSGGRGLADAQLQELMRNPEAVAATDPAFKLRVMGAQRANAQYGQDSGAMSVAGANASTDWYNARLAQLGGMAGAGVAPGAGGGVMIQGLDNAFDASSAALASLGYAAGTAGAGTGGLTPAQRAQLAKLAIGG